MTRLNVLFRHGPFLGFALVLALMSSQSFGQNRSLLDLYKDKSRTIPRTGISRMSEEAKKFTEASQEPQLLAPLEGAVNDTRCVNFLASDEAGFITGSTLSINGGQYMV